ncbi:MAG TPA: hypothetical protein VEF34_01235 [Syntrophobacteraceae bacterium]|nr:hypothetical protein [Syntrophobacteraceae bacterium]
MNKYQELRSAIRAATQKIDKPVAHEMEKHFRAELESLRDDGLIALGPDYQLTSFPLEYRVREIFKKVGFEVVKGRDYREDAVIHFERGNPRRPLVLEVKSSRKTQIERSDLRQLDDWVFDLSKEEQARKFGLRGTGGGVDPMAIVSWGIMNRNSGASVRHHPSPHKGVMVFNGPLEIPFKERKSRCLSINDEEFVDKRNLCIIPFDLLIRCLDQYAKNRFDNMIFWERIHSTAGILEWDNQFSI